MNNFKVDKREILKRTSRGLQWENKPLKLKRSIASNILGKPKSFCSGYISKSGTSLLASLVGKVLGTKRLLLLFSLK